MKLAYAREQWQYYSEKLSAINRNFCFAGIAVVWIFTKTDNNGGLTVPTELMWPMLLFVISLTLDLFHYVFAAALWGGYQRLKEKNGVDEEMDFLAPAWINRPSLFFLWAKVTSAVGGFGLLFKYFVTNLN